MSMVGLCDLCKFSLEDSRDPSRRAAYPMDLLRHADSLPSKLGCGRVTLPINSLRQRHRAMASGSVSSACNYHTGTLVDVVAGCYFSTKFS